MRKEERERTNAMSYFFARLRLARPTGFLQPRFHCSLSPTPPINSKLFVAGLRSLICVVLSSPVADLVALAWMKVYHGMWMRSLSKMRFPPSERSRK
ncbi:hypothetical protein Cni_G26731 [Canna indica]|uniref:Uncharacterized protein n=1 Tax=Canna indica TaxID=4628 RepID=A0AAQ3QQP0_9LILI|nr:hypothetical protein Cni_G26731 [Canna indica]